MIHVMENYENRSIIKMTNDGNESFWWCSTILMHKNNRDCLNLKELRYSTNLNHMAQGLCVDCGFDYSKRVNVDSIPSIIKQVCEANGIEFLI